LRSTFFQPRSNVRPRRIFFLGRPVTSAQQRQSAQNLFFLGRPITAAQQCQGAQKKFLGSSDHFRAAVSGRAAIFLGRPVTSTQLLLTFVALGISASLINAMSGRVTHFFGTPFQNPAQYFFSFYCWKNLLFTAQSRLKFKFFGIFPLTISGSLTALVRSG
jgi:hypothetical protein